MSKTRTIEHEDGRLEILRVLSPDEMETWDRDAPLAYERSIVWLEDVRRLDYVRVAEVSKATSRKGPLRWKGSGRVIGYSVLTRDAPRNPDDKTFTRRLFYLKVGDRDSDPYGEYQHKPPRHAVDPRTILPGEEGRPSVR